MKKWKSRCSIVLFVTLLMLVVPQTSVLAGSITIPASNNVKTFNAETFAEDGGWYIGTITVGWNGNGNKSVDVTWDGNEGEVIITPYAVENNKQETGTLEVKIEQTAGEQNVVFTLTRNNGQTLTAEVVVPGLPAPPIVTDATTRGGWTLTGPIAREGKFGWPFASYVGDLSKIGYVEEEYFIEGIAQFYEAVGALPQMGDGNWTIQPAQTAPYKTRILVQRPIDPAKFNGTVVCEWTNVSAGYEIIAANSQGLFEEGYAFVAISAQPVGVHGNPPGSGDRAELGLQQWDPERYASLLIPGEGACYDIFTQAARAVGPDRPRDGVDPMGGLDVLHLVGVGESQSGSRVAGYINGVQPLEKVFDGLIPIVYGGAASDFENEIAHSGSSGGSARTVFTRLRDDGSAKVFAIQSQTEAVYYSRVRQPNTDTFRAWEVAASVHGGTFMSRNVNRITDRDGWSDTLNTFKPAQNINEVSWLFAYEGALMQMQKWITGQGEPPVFEPLQVDTNSKYVYGDDGIVKGGVRLPPVTVPTAGYLIDQSFGLSGVTVLYNEVRLKQLYPTHEDYVAKVTAAANQAAEDGIIMPCRIDYFIRQANAADIPEQQLPEAARNFLNQ